MWKMCSEGFNSLKIAIGIVKNKDCFYCGLFLERYSHGKRGNSRDHATSRDEIREGCYIHFLAHSMFNLPQIPKCRGQLTTVSFF